MAVYEEEVPNGMAITPEPSIPNTRMGTTPVTAASDFTTVGVDNRYAPATSLTTMIGGSPTKVDYYQKYLGASSETSGVMIGRSPVHESYKEIKDLVIRLDGALSKPSQDEGTKNFSMTGEAKILPPLKPSKGDMLVLPLGDGRKGLFLVTGATKESLHKASIYTINFSLQDYANPGVDLFDSLLKKVINQVFYVESLLEYARNPFVEPQTMKLMREGSGFYKTILEDWLYLFLSDEYGTSMLPQAKTIHDPFLHKFVLKAFDVSDTYKMGQLGGFQAGGMPDLKAVSVWDAIINRENFLVTQAFSKAAPANTRSLSRRVRLKTGALSFIDAVIWPNDPAYTTDNSHWLNLNPGVGGLVNEHSTGRGVNGVVSDLVLVATEAQPLWYPVIADEYYVFSKAFYNNEAGMSVLEVCVWDYIQDRPLNPNRLLELINNYRYLQGLDKFYLAPVLALLLRSFCKGL